MLSIDTSPRSVYRWAMQHGWTPEQAGSWAAYCNGVPIVVDDEPLREAWTVRQINVLLFLRHVHATDTTTATASAASASVA